MDGRLPAIAAHPVRDQVCCYQEVDEKAQDDEVQNHHENEHRNLGGMAQRKLPGNPVSHGALLAEASVPPILHPVRQRLPHPPWVDFCLPRSHPDEGDVPHLRARHHVGMAKKKKTEREQTESGPPQKMKRKEYERHMRILHGELVAMQEWVKDAGAKICVVFEGRDTAGKGGTIKRITERVSPRVFRVVALPTPTEREKSQMYVQRYVPHFPAAGEVVIFDRSWYNRAGVERVMGFCKPEETERFLALVPAFEKAMADSGILLLKYWLEVSPDEQTRRLE